MLFKIRPEKTEDWGRHIPELVRVFQSFGARFRAVERRGEWVAVASKWSEGLRDVPAIGEWLDLESGDGLSPRPLVSRGDGVGDTVVDVGGRLIGDGRVQVIAGPCAVESESQAFAVAERLRSQGFHFFRGGVFKPRSSPYSFQGMGPDGISILREVRDRFGLKVVSEAIDERCLEAMADAVDVVQIGSRNMQNISLLKAAGEIGKPVLLKRGMSSTIEEFLLAAEYIVLHGNDRVILCERGIRTFADHCRNTLDISAIPVLKRETHLPVVVDPSHAAGLAAYVPSLSLAAVAAGADGIMVEVHPDPPRALSDGPQSLAFPEWDALVLGVSSVARAVGRRLSNDVHDP